MKPWIRRTLVALAALLLVIGIAAVVAVQLGERKRERRIEVPVAPIAFRSDAATVERGDYLYRSRGCADCHGLDGGGKVVIEDGGMRIAGPGITRAPGSVTASYGEADWVRVIRHGVKPDGRPVFIMPSEDYNRLTDSDVAAVVAHVRQLPPVPARPAEIRLPVLVKALYGVGVVRDAAQKIDHSLPPAQAVAEGVTLEHGRYVAQSCKAATEGTSPAARSPARRPTGRRPLVSARAERA